MPEIDEAACWYTLLCDGPLPRRATKRLVFDWAIEAGRPLAELYEYSATSLAQELTLSASQATALLASRERALSARQELDAWADKGVGLVTRAEASYPGLLVEHLPEEQLPYLLFHAGSLTLATEPGVAILGADAPSDEAREVATLLAGSLANNGQRVIGGYGRGVDRLATTHTLAQGGSVVLFLPLGFEGFEPARAPLEPYLAQGQLLMMSPFAPCDPYDERRGQARLGLVGALSGALALIEPQHDTVSWEWVTHLVASGGIALVWSGSEAEAARSWIDRGAQPFDDAAGAARQLAQLFGSSPQQAAAQTDGVDPGESDLEPFATPDEALGALSKGGRVPEALAKRLRAMRESD